jgi:peptidoglycan/LPS O-acetylase OafA/YrhL
MRRLYELDALRFVAAVAVMFCHFAGVPQGGAWPRGARPTFPELNPAADFGFLGVQLFFVISGFVILMSVWGRRPSDFAVSRIVRLFPAYWCAVLLTVAVFFTTRAAVDYGPGSEGVLRRFLPNLTMLQTGIGAPNMEVVYWSLWTELHFYALIMLLAWRGVTYRRAVVFAAGWLIFSIFANEANFGPAQVILIPHWAPYFIAGMAFYLIYRFGSNLALWLLTGFCWAIATYGEVKEVNPINAWPGVHEYAIPGIISGIFLVMALVATHRLGWLRWRGFALLGALTYPLYLVHETVSRPLIKSLAPHLDRWIVLGMAITCALTVAYLVHRLVERPTGRLLRVHLKRAVEQIRVEGRWSPDVDAGVKPDVSAPDASSADRESMLTRR